MYCSTIIDVRAKVDRETVIPPSKSFRKDPQFGGVQSKITAAFIISHSHQTYNRIEGFRTSSVLAKCISEHS